MNLYNLIASIREDADVGVPGLLDRKRDLQGVTGRYRPMR